MFDDLPLDADFDLPVVTFEPVPVLGFDLPLDAIFELPALELDDLPLFRMRPRFFPSHYGGGAKHFGGIIGGVVKP